MENKDKFTKMEYIKFCLIGIAVLYGGAFVIYAVSDLVVWISIITTLLIALLMIVMVVALAITSVEIHNYGFKE